MSFSQVFAKTSKEKLGYVSQRLDKKHFIKIKANGASLTQIRADNSKNNNKL